MKVLKIFFYVIIGLAILFYIAVITSSPIRKVQEINKIATSDSVFMKKNKAITKFSMNLLPLVKEKAYKEAQISLANQDSIGLIINFKDSVASLMLKGVEIYSSKIIKYKKDIVFNGIDAPAFRKIFSKPLHNIQDYSTFVKEPIVVKRAPKDTIEAMKMATLPVLLPVDPAYVSFNLDFGFKLILIQDKWNSDEEKIIEKKFKSDLRRQTYENVISGILNLKKPFYTPTVIVEMEGRDVRAIYRALPYKSSIIMLL
jgi:hypothetical protein